MKTVRILRRIFLASLVAAVPILVRGQNVQAITTIQIITNLSKTLGTNFYSPLTEGDDGAFYGGTTYNIFRLSKTGAIKKLYNVPVVNHLAGKAYMFQSLVRNRDGKIYGATGSGPDAQSKQAVFFGLDPVTQAFTVLHTFGNGNDLSNPGQVIVVKMPDAFVARVMYGTATGGGDFGYGGIYRITETGDYSIVHSFDGGFGRCSSIAASFEYLNTPAVMIWGTASDDQNGIGELFKLPTAGSGFQHCYDFGLDGQIPLGVVCGGSDNVYVTGRSKKIAGLTRLPFLWRCQGDPSQGEYLPAGYLALQSPMTQRDWYPNLTLGPKIFGISSGQQIVGLDETTGSFTPIASMRDLDISRLSVAGDGVLYGIGTTNRVSVFFKVTGYNANTGLDYSFPSSVPAGNFTGLLSPNDITVQDPTVSWLNSQSGYVNLNIDASTKLSGKIWIEGTNYSVPPNLTISLFKGTGFILTRANKPDIQFSLWFSDGGSFAGNYLNLDSTPCIGGSAYMGNTLTLYAPMSVSTSYCNPKPLAGTYTVSLVPTAQATTGSAGWGGYGKLVIDKTGKVTGSGVLSDLSSYSILPTSVNVFEQIQTYIPLYKRSGGIMLRFYLNPEAYTGLKPCDIHGVGIWMKPPGIGTNFAGGFSQGLDIRASKIIP